MTILFFTRLFYPHIGGVEKHVWEVARLLVKDGHKVVVVTENHSWEEVESVDGIQIYRIPVGETESKKKIKIWKWLWHHKKLIQNADIIHCHDVFFWYLPFRFLFPFKKVYITFHGYETTYPPTKKAIRARKLAKQLSFGNICMGSYIENWYGTKANFISYGGITPAREIIRRKANKTLRIAFVGRLEMDNGINLYIQAIQKLKEKNIPYAADFYGNGSLRNNAANVGTVHGFTKNAEETIQEADIVFASSYLAMLEALSKKKLVISVYTNPLKRDYLTLSPFPNYVYIFRSEMEVFECIKSYVKNPQVFSKKILEGYAWSQTQTWKNVKEMYYKLWNIS